MKQNKRQSYLDMIENAAKLQREEHSWVSNLYQKRLTELEKQTANYEHWLQSRNEHAWWRMRACLSNRRRIHRMRDRQLYASRRW